MRPGPLALIALVILLAGNTTWAAGDAAAGQAKSAACQACHGAAGEGAAAGYPVLAGQHASYLAKALADYRDGRRDNAIMQGFAGNLSDQDIADLAAWYASREGLDDLSTR
ncbi:MAG: c-type cytochrome [Xanthomonadales bacterium]|nr:c-type cytochrome [Xanthomonadales bacterium]NIN58658.1 c-type cytochrome [Xanthomonadales bacterium]NIN73953.1 c-type cytochrome [Xanthomonadales bacterium]NIO14585.1 c-type cytochrome [Xanthomonadales bacterium]NIP11051.1 c-type cytochrome [Xanthomonadales bacterium]